MEREGPNCCLWVVGGTESLAKENDLYHAAKLGIPLVCLSVLKAAPLPSHHHHLGLEAHSFFGDHSRLRIRSLPPAAIPLSHSPWCTLGDLPKVFLHCPAQGPELQTKAWAPDFLHVACLPSCATDFCLDTSYSAACSSRLNDSQLPQGVGPLLTDLMLPNMPGHLLKRSLPFVTCFLLSTFKTLLILVLPLFSQFGDFPTCSPVSPCASVSWNIYLSRGEPCASLCISQCSNTY